MSENMQYTCPDCGAVGAHPKTMKPPYCHKCEYRVVMKPSNNGEIKFSYLRNEDLDHLVSKELFDRFQLAHKSKLMWVRLRYSLATLRYYFRIRFEFENEEVSLPISVAYKMINQTVKEPYFDLVSYVEEVVCSELK